MRRMLDPAKVQPQAILTMDGRVLDPSILVCALLKDSAEVQVQYAPGPAMFSARWVSMAPPPPPPLLARAGRL